MRIRTGWLITAKFLSSIVATFSENSMIYKIVIIYDNISCSNLQASPIQHDNYVNYAMLNDPHVYPICCAGNCLSIGLDGSN